MRSSLDELHSSLFFSKNYSTLFHMWLGLSFTGSSMNWHCQDGAAVSEKTGYHPIPPSLRMWQEKIPQLRPQKLEELPGVGILMIGEIFRGKTVKKWSHES